MPESIREHIRDCSDCHAFIRQWNAVEVGLITMRAHGPSVSPGFAAALDSRLQGVQQGPAFFAWFRRQIPPRQARLALVGSSAILALWMIYILSAAVLGGISRHNSTTMAANADLHRDPPSPIPAQIQVAPIR